MKGSGTRPSSGLSATDLSGIAERNANTSALTLEEQGIWTDAFPDDTEEQSSSESAPLAQPKSRPEVPGAQPALYAAEEQDSLVNEQRSASWAIYPGQPKSSASSHLHIKAGILYLEKHVTLLPKNGIRVGNPDFAFNEYYRTIRITRGVLVKIPTCETQFATLRGEDPERPLDRELWYELSDHLNPGYRGQPFMPKIKPYALE